MKSAFGGTDFSSVRVHIDEDGERVAGRLGTGAVTLGHHIYFARGAFQPTSAHGREVLAHELAHVLQAQRGHSGDARHGVALADGAAEREALVVGRRVAANLPAGMPAPPAAPARGQTSAEPLIFRFPGVVPEALAEDRTRLIDPGNPASERVYTDARGYIRNPTATRLRDVISNGRVGGQFRNGTYMYVVDQRGDVWVGLRQGQNMPHPTLIGGRAPEVQAAGMLEIRGGEIVRVDNHSGHFRPPRSALRSASQALTSLPREAIRRLQAVSVHFERVDGVERTTYRPLRTLRLALARLRQVRLTRPLQRLRGRWRHDARFRSRMGGRARGAAAIIALLIIDYFLSRWRQQLEQAQMERDLERLMPRVREQLMQSLMNNADTLDQLLEANPRSEIFLNMRFRVGRLTEADPHAGPIETYWGTELVSASYALIPTPELTSSSFEQIGCTSSISWESFAISERVPLEDLYSEEPDEDEPAPAGANP